MKLLLSRVYAWDFYFVTIMVCNDLIVSNLLSAKNKQTCWFVVLKCERLLLLTLVVFSLLKNPCDGLCFSPLSTAYMTLLNNCCS